MGFTKILEHFHHFLEIKNIFTRNFEKCKTFLRIKNICTLKWDFLFKKWPSYAILSLADSNYCHRVDSTAPPRDSTLQCQLVLFLPSGLPTLLFSTVQRCYFECRPTDFTQSTVQRSYSYSELSKQYLLTLCVLWPHTTLKCCQRAVKASQR